MHFMALAVSMTLGISAQAGSIVYSPAFCQIVSSNPDVYWNWSRLFNDSTTNMLKVYCPAINDTHTNIESGWVMVLDQNVDDNIQCRLITNYQVDNGGADHYATSYEYSSGYSSYWQRLDFGALTNDDTTTIHYECWIPLKDIGRSGIGSYEVSQ